MPHIDLNSDIGEGLPEETDLEILRLVTSANVACGGHAGDLSTMRRTAEACVRLGVRIGAHPSYPDRENFGRVSRSMPAAELLLSVIGQVRTLSSISNEAGGRVEYIKPHGALYHDRESNPEVSAVITEASDELGLTLMGTSGPIKEGFIDRRYSRDGTLAPRSSPGAMITDPAAAADQALALAPSVDSLCVHSDTPNSVRLVAAARDRLIEAGYRISAR